MVAQAAPSQDSGARVKVAGPENFARRSCDRIFLQPMVFPPSKSTGNDSVLPRKPVNLRLL